MRSSRLASVLVAFVLLACDAPEVIPRDVELETGADPLATGPSAEIVRQVDRMKAAIEGEEKPVTILVTIGNLYYENGRYLDAIDWYRQAIVSARPATERYRELVEAGVEASEQAPEACKLATGVMDGFEQAVAVAAELEAEGQKALALACYREALAPVVEAHSRRGGAWSVLERPKLAIEHIEEALAIRPDDPQSLYLFGAIIFNTGGQHPDVARMGRARAAWRRFVEIAPDHPRAAQIRDALKGIDQMAGVSPAPTETPAGAPTPGAIEMPPTAQGLPPALAEAERRLVAGDPAGALSIYESFLAVAPNHPLALAGKARALVDQGRGVEAEPVLRSALTAARNARTVFAMADWYERVAGDKAQAKKLFEEAASLDATFAEAAGIAARISKL